MFSAAPRISSPKKSSQAFSWFWPILIGFGIAIVLYFIYGDVRLDLSDEGFLWYGVIHIRAGEAPIRDFQSYDPARYYWCAAFSFIFGTGILAVRFASTLFQGMCLSFGLAAVQRIVQSPFYLLIIGFLSSCCMFWSFRYFDAGIALVAYYFAVRFAEQPDLKRAFQAGAMAGISFFVGLNHGFFIAAGLFLLILYYCLRKLVEKAGQVVAWFGAGIFVGFLPLITMALVYPGFFGRYTENLFHLGRNYLKGGTSMIISPASIPTMPWNVHWGLVSAGAWSWPISLILFFSELGRGMFFLTVCSLAVLLFFLMITMKKKDPIEKNPVFVAGVFIGGAYFYQAISRSDMTHFMEGVFPLSAAVLALSHTSFFLNRKNAAKAIVIWMAVWMFAASFTFHNWFFKIQVPEPMKTQCPIGSDKIWMLKSEAAGIERMRRVIAQCIAPQESVFLAPLLTTFYCLENKKSPTYQIYYFFSLSKEIEVRDVEALERQKVPWAILSDDVLLGRQDLHLSATYPVLWRYLRSHFEVVTREGLLPGYVLMKRKNLNTASDRLDYNPLPR